MESALAVDIAEELQGCGNYTGFLSTPGQSRAMAANRHVMSVRKLQPLFVASDFSVEANPRRHFQIKGLKPQ